MTEDLRKLPELSGNSGADSLTSLLRVNLYEPTTIKFLNFRTPENFAVIYLKFN